MKHIILLALLSTQTFILFAQNSTYAAGKSAQKSFGGNSIDDCKRTFQTMDGGYLLAGYSYSDISGNKTENTVGINETDFWVIKLNASGQIQWQNDIGGTDLEELNDAKQTSDGGYILAGFSSSNISGDKSENRVGPYSRADYWVVKLNADGSIAWQNTIGSENDDIASCIVETTDNGFIVAGSSWGNMYGDKTDNNHGGFTYDYWIVKLDNNGNVLWDKSYGGQGDDHAYSIYQTQDGGYIIGGESDSQPFANKTSPNYGYTDYWIIKTDPDGNIEWQNSYGGSSEERKGFTIPTLDGGYIITGYSYSDVSGNKTQQNFGAGDYWIIKIDAHGSITWQKEFGGTGNDFSQVIHQTKDNGYIVGGYSYSSISGNKTSPLFGQADYWIVKLKPNGNLQWQNSFGGSLYDYLYDIQQTKDNGYIASGTSNSGMDGIKAAFNYGESDYWILKLNSAGAIQTIPSAIKPLDHFIVQPNPARDFIVISTDSATIISITDINGKVYSTIKIFSGKTQISIKNLLPGTYRVTDIYSKKNKLFIKE